MELMYGKNRLALYDRNINWTLPLDDNDVIVFYEASTGRIFHRDGSVAFRPEDLGVFYSNGWCAFCEDSAAILDPEGKKLFRLPDDADTETGITYDENGKPDRELPFITVELGSDLLFDIGPHTFRLWTEDQILITSNPLDLYL
ncbi:MAG: hypothetical protein R2817_00785 [Flavobacteriales bacterium]